MAKKQTRRSISVSRATYERLKAFCEANNISMSQFVETRVGDFLGDEVTAQEPMLPRPAASTGVAPSRPDPRREAARPTPPPVSLASAVRVVVEPPPPIIKPKQDQPAPAPAIKTADQIFTF